MQGCPKFSLNGATLHQDPDMLYLGVNLTPSKHIELRSKACRRSFYALQSAGMHPKGLTPATIAHLWKLAIRPCLTYGIHCIHLRTPHLNSLEKTQSSLIKSTLALKKSCHNTPLLDALNIPRVNVTLQQQAIKTLRSSFMSSSGASDFYGHILDVYFKGFKVDNRGLVHRVISICDEHSVSFIGLLLDRRHSMNFLKSCANDGVTDSCKQLLNFYCDSNQRLLNLLLASF